MAHLSGFRLDRHLRRRYEGAHEVRVVVCGAQGGETQKVGSVFATGTVGFAASPVEEQDRSTPDITAEQAEEFRFELDAPALLNGAMIEPVSGRMTIEGWLLTRSGIADFKVLLDGQLLGNAHCGLARQDVGAAFPGMAERAAQRLCLPFARRAACATASTRVRMEIRANNGVELARSFKMVVKKPEDHEDAVAIRRRVPRVEVDMMLALMAGMDQRPAFRFILRQGRGVDIDALRATLGCASAAGLSGLDGAVAGGGRRYRDADCGASSMMRCRFWRGGFSVLCPSTGAAWAEPLGAGGSLLQCLLLAGRRAGCGRASGVRGGAVPACRRRPAVWRRGSGEPGQPREGAFLQTGFFSGSVIVDKLYRAAVGGHRRSAREDRRLGSVPD